MTRTRRYAGALLIAAATATAAQPVMGVELRWESNGKSFIRHVAHEASPEAGSGEAEPLAPAALPLQSTSDSKFDHPLLMDEVPGDFDEALSAGSGPLMPPPWGPEYGPWRFWGELDYLIWWRQGRVLPPLVTTEPNRGVLPQATTLLGDETVGNEAQSGAR